MRVIEYDYLRNHLSAELSRAYRDGEATVVAWWDRPVGVLMSEGVWSQGREVVPVPDSVIDEPMNSRAARPALRVLREKLERGRHVTVTVYSDAAVIAPYGWAREAFLRWDLPELLQPVPARGCVLVAYRSARMVKKLAGEFVGAVDPEWEIDRRLAEPQARISLDRRERLRGVVYVEAGRVVRVRTVDPEGQWVDLEGRVSLAPVSAPLTRAEIDSQLPGLGLYPGDQRLTPRGVSREYVDSV
ncbi:hypothetical protein [Nocardia vermiculata]|uniref:Uncharacterized protein n=1 Tax=Nocardia vermiculata TaxID=257274 RepID=A0A846YAU1_9NOCA|nr:hypothetical protein [Nocardia vermiculata]NKY53889.1 hypothetical protein [Nocardia vermiculata]